MYPPELLSITGWTKDSYKLEDRRMAGGTSINKRLDMILEDGPTSMPDDAYRNVLGVAGDLEQTKKRLQKLEIDLKVAVDRMCAGLALGVRRLQPNLHVSVGSGYCKINFLKKTLAFKPDLIRRVWLVESSHPKFVNRFRRLYGHKLHLSSDLNELAASVATFFTDFYRSIGKPIEEARLGGSTLMEGARVSLSQLTTYVKRKDADLMLMKTEIW